MEPNEPGSDSDGTVIGVSATERVLVAADTRVTTRGVKHGRAEKLAAVHPSGVLGSPDDLGPVQSLVRSIQAAADRYETAHGRPTDMSTLGTVAVRELRQADTETAFVLGGIDGDGPHVFTLSGNAGALESDYAAIGGGRDLAYGVFDAEATTDLPIARARRLVSRAMEAALERDEKTGGGIHLAEITQDAVEIHEFDSVTDMT